MPANIDRFNENVGWILARLYVSFPIPSPIRGEDCHGVAKQRHRNATTGLVSHYTYTRAGESFDAEQGELVHESFNHTLAWLLDEGFITSSAAKIPAIWHPGTHFRLTHQGLELLKAVPSSVGTGGTFGDQLIEAGKDGATVAVGKVVEQGLTDAIARFGGQFVGSMMAATGGVSGG